ncbi:MAG: HU family DNA-binding protein [Bacteroidales bacterium]|jgi:predicted histone-like DNA-binding protein|nr:HU family DNA-binding protein [Bacteroidales bacterium]
MGIKYIAREKGNPLKPKEQKKWYASTKSTGDVTLKALGKEIAHRSTVSHADTQAVLIALTEVLVEHLSDNQIVRLGDFGSFQVSISSEGVEKEEKVTASIIKNSKVIFRPGTDIKEMLNNLKYEKA